MRKVKKSLAIILLAVSILAGCQNLEHTVRDWLTPVSEETPVAEHKSTVKSKDVKEAAQEAAREAKAGAKEEAERPQNGPAERALLPADGSPLANSLAYLQFGLVDAVTHFQAFYPDAKLTQITLAPEADHYVYHLQGQDEAGQYTMTLDGHTGCGKRQAERGTAPQTPALTLPSARLNQQVKAVLKEMTAENGSDYTQLTFKIFVEGSRPQVEVTLAAPVASTKNLPEKMSRRYDLNSGERLDEAGKKVTAKAQGDQDAAKAEEEE